MRLDLPQPAAVEPLQPRHAVLAPAPLELVEPPELAGVARDDQLAAALVGDAVLVAVLVEEPCALHAQLRL